MVSCVSEIKQYCPLAFCMKLLEVRPWGVCPVWRAEPMDLALRGTLILGCLLL